MIIFGDLHLHLYHPVIGNDYLELGLNALIQVRDFALANNDKNIIHLGDTFQLKDRIPTRVWNLFFEELVIWEKKGLTSYWLEGNHDFKTDSTIQAFQSNPFAIPIMQNISYTIDDMHCAFMPYDKTVPHNFPSPPDILFMHNYIKNFSKITDTITSEEGISISDLNQFPLVISGHSHMFQKITDTIYHLGSPYQTNFNEVGQKKYFAQFKSNKLTFHEFDCPQLLVVYPGSDLSEVKDAYVKFTYNADELTEEEVREYILEMMHRGVRKVKIEPIRNKLEVKERIKVSNTKMTEEEYMKEYIKIKNPSLDKELLLKIGKNIIK